MLSPGQYMLSMQDCFAAARNDNPATGRNFVSWGVWAVAQPRCGRLVNKRHIMKNGNPVPFTPAEEALEMIKAWWEGNTHFRSPPNP